MTMPTLILAAIVVKVWGKSVKVKPESSHDWFILGVVSGFSGAFLDNLYWLIPWTASFLDLKVSNDLIMYGVFFNIFFRQGLGIFAAYCHLKAANAHGDKLLFNLNKSLVVANILGVIYSLVLIYVYATS